MTKITRDIGNHEDTIIMQISTDQRSDNRVRTILFITLHWLLLVLSVYLLITGLGISYYRIFEKLTFGLVPKLLLFKHHALFWKPFALLLTIHVIVIILKKRQRHTKNT